MGISTQELTDSSLSLDSLGPFLHANAEQFGRYARLLLHELQLKARTFDSPSPVAVPEIFFRDLKSKDFYGAIAKQVAPARISLGLL